MLLESVDQPGPGTAFQRQPVAAIVPVKPSHGAFAACGYPFSYLRAEGRGGIVMTLPVPVVSPSGWPCAGSVLTALAFDVPLAGSVRGVPRLLVFGLLVGLAGSVVSAS